MRVCHCTLAGTKACDTCSSGTGSSLILNPVYSQTGTTTVDLDGMRAEIKRLRAELATEKAINADYFRRQELMVADAEALRAGNDKLREAVFGASKNLDGKDAEIAALRAELEEARKERRNWMQRHAEVMVANDALRAEARMGGSS